MDDYKKLLDGIRHCATEAGCSGCPYEDPRDPLCECANNVSKEAAQAIESLQKEMKEYRETGLKPEEIADVVTDSHQLNDHLKEFAEDVARQFAYRVKTIDGHAAYSSGGLSTLETAFDILEWDEPHPCPECECEATGCHEWATCGTPTKDGYKRLCGKHFRAVQEDTSYDLTH